MAIFNGKDHTWCGYSKWRAKATKQADAMRKKGYKVRIEKKKYKKIFIDNKTYTNKTVYNIYARK